MDRPSATPITRLLAEWRGGDKRALDAIVPQVYDELRGLAARHLASERPDHTLQATALVHEAYARLVDADISWLDRVHFFAVASGTMRRVLVDHARARGAEKRGGAFVAVTLHEGLLAEEAPIDRLLDLDQAMERLASFDERKGKVVELRYFGGLNATEIASVLEVGVATVQRDLRAARAWLLKELSGEAPSTSGRGDVSGPAAEGT
jgi:RNA polymerase sigma factor (TIGR02999 family)